MRAVLFDVAGTLAMPEDGAAWGAACGIETLILPMTPAGSVHGLRAVLERV